MYSIRFTNRFKKDVKRCKKRGYNLSELEDAIDILQNQGKLPPKFKAHVLSGQNAGLWECHLKPDWLVVLRNSILSIVHENTPIHRTPHFAEIFLLPMILMHVPAICKKKRKQNQK
jgi:mRNA interferase YafQ